MRREQLLFARRGSPAFRRAGGNEWKTSSMKHSNSAAGASTSRTRDVQIDPVHPGNADYQHVDKTLAEAAQLVPLSEPGAGPPVRRNHSQETMYWRCFPHNAESFSYLPDLL